VSDPTVRWDRPCYRCRSATCSGICAPPWSLQVYAPEVIELAKKLYLRNLVVPSWDQLGDVTRSVWCDEAQRILDLA
jgi:hypothetical protein